MITLQHLLGLKRSVNTGIDFNILHTYARPSLSCGYELCCIVAAQLLWDLCLEWIKSYSDHIHCYQVVVHYVVLSETEHTMKSCEKSLIVSCTFPTCNNVWKLYIDGRPVLTVPVLLSIRSWWTLDGNMTSIYSANHSWEVPIFIELHFIVGLASSIRKLDVKTVNYSTQFLHWHHTSLVSWWQIPDAKNLNVIRTWRELGKGLPLWDGEESLGSSKDIISNAFSLHIRKRSKKAISSK